MNHAALPQDADLPCVGGGIDVTATAVNTVRGGDQATNQGANRTMTKKPSFPEVLAARAMREQDLASQATAATRTATGIRRLLDAYGSLMNPADVAALTKAAGALATLRNALVQAKQLRAADDTAKARRVKAAERIVGDIFAGVVTLEDKIALIAAAGSWRAVLESGSAGINAREAEEILTREYTEALETIAWRIADDPSADLDQAAAKALQRFNAARPGLHQKHASLIASIQAALPNA